MLCLLFVSCVCVSSSHPCASQALEDYTSLQGSPRKGSRSDIWYSEKEELLTLLAGYKREDSLDSLDSVDSKTYSTSPDATLKGSSEGKMHSLTTTFRLHLSCLFLTSSRFERNKQVYER